MSKTVKLVAATVVLGLVSLVCYYFSNNRAFSVLPLGLFVVLGAAIHRPYAFFIIYAMLPVETLTRLTPYLTVSKLLGLLVVANFIVTGCRRNPIVPTAAKLLIGLAALTLLSAIWAIDSVAAITLSVSAILHVGLIVILINSVKTESMLKLLMWGLIVGSLLAAILFIAGIGVDTGPARVERASFQAENPNTTASAFGLSLIAAAYLFFDSRLRYKVAILLLLLPIVHGFVQTQSRTAIFATAVALVGATVMQIRGRRKVLYICVSTFLCAILVGCAWLLLATNYLPEESRERLLSTRENLESSERIHFWKEGLEFFAERPILGCGFNNYSVRYGGVRLVENDAHSTYISIAVELGILGLVILGSVYFVLIKESLSIDKSSLQVLSLSLLFFNIVNGIAHTTYEQKVFWYTLGFSCVIVVLSKRGFVVGRHF